MSFKNHRKKKHGHLRFAALAFLASNLGSAPQVTAEPAPGNTDAPSETEFLAPNTESETAITPTSCYRIPIPSIPDSHEEMTEDTQLWCYRSLKERPGSVFVFNADGNKVSPELAAIVDSSGKMLHGSLLAGETTIHQVDALNFNPMPFPLTPPASLERGHIDAAKLRALDPSIEETLKFFRSHPPVVQNLHLRAGTVSKSAKATTVPWRGYWWPYKSMRLSTGDSSPLAKWDRFLRSRGQESEAQEWEKANHDYRGVKWQGHCNGWAASAILRKEPKKSLKDSRSGITFTVADIKGLLAEKDNCVKFVFFGERYRENWDSDPNDIHPQEFHKTITYYIGQLKKPVIMDHLRGVGIENNVISAYTMTTEASGPSSYTVTVKLRVHKYDRAPSSVPGTAQAVTRTLKYRLTTDASGKVISQKWLTKNPDFLWVPLGEAQCRPTNPYVTEEWIEKLTN